MRTPGFSSISTVSKYGFLIAQCIFLSSNYVVQAATPPFLGLQNSQRPEVLISRLRTREVTVDALAALSRPDGSLAGGISTPIKIRLEQGQGPSVSVAFFESERDTVRTGMRASGWMAVTISSLLLGNSLGEYNFSFDAEGTNLDGASAGGLFTVAVLALLLDDDMRPDTTMTGTINPDGSIGIVGGIPQKLEGASQANKQLVLIPEGTRGPEVIAAERRLGIEVKEVGNIYEAYQELTGQPLQRISNSNNTAELSISDISKIELETRNYHRQYQELRQSGEEIPIPSNELAKNLVEELFRLAESYFSRSRQYLAQGSVSGAYVTALEANTYLNSAIEIADNFSLLEQSGSMAVVETLRADAQRSNESIESIFTQLSRIQPTTTGNAIALTKAYRELALGWATRLQAGFYIQALQEATSPEEQLLYTYSATTSTAFINLALQNAIPLLNISLDEEDNGSPPPNLQTLQSFSHNYFQSASANLGYFESLIAQREGVSVETVQEQFGLIDQSYITVAVLRKIAADAEGLNLPEESKAYLRLAASISCYNLSSLLIAKYYSLGVELDQNGQVIGFRNQIALNEMLDFAERRARDSIALSERNGSNPVLQIAEYEGAELLQRGDPNDQLTALWRFWNASSEAELANIFTGQSLVR